MDQVIRKLENNIKAHAKCLWPDLSMYDVLFDHVNSLSESFKMLIFARRATLLTRLHVNAHRCNHVSLDMVNMVKIIIIEILHLCYFNN